MSAMHEGAVGVLERPVEADAPKAGGMLHWLAGSRGGHAIMLGALSGVLATLSLEDYHIWPLIFVAFVPAIVAQHRVMPARFQALPLAIAIGMMFQGYLGPGLAAAARGGGLDWYMQIFGIWVGLIVLALARGSRRFHIRTNYRWFVLATPAAWVAVDALRGFGADMLGGTWGSVSYALYDRPSLIQPASIFGIHGVTFMILVINWTLAKVVLTWLDRLRGPVDERAPIVWKSTRSNVGLVGAAIVVWIAASMAMMSGTSDSTVRVAAIQPGIAKLFADGTYERTPQEEVLRRQIEQTREAKRQGAELVTWHESGFKGDARGDEGKVLSDLADELDIYLTVGWGIPRPDIGGRYNEVAAFDPDGKFLGTYGKSHVGDFAGDAGNNDRKGLYATYAAPFGKFGTIICFDLDFTNAARSTVRRGANVLAVSSSDPPGIEEKHSTHMVFRAIETRLGLLKADSLHDSIIVDPWGRIVDYKVTRGGGRATLVADLPYRPLGAQRTFYAQWGEWFGFINLGLVAMFVVMSAWLRRKDRLTGSLEGAEDLRIGMTGGAGPSPATGGAGPSPAEEA